MLRGFTRMALIATALVGAMVAFGHQSDAKAATQAPAKVQHTVRTASLHTCGGQADNLSQLLRHWHEQGITEPAAAFEGVDTVNETLAGHAKEHWGVATLSQPMKTTANKGCDGHGHMGDAQNRQKQAGDKMVVDTDPLRAKYPHGFSLKPRAGWKRVQERLSTVAQGSCSNPVHGHGMFWVWIPPTKVAVHHPTPCRAGYHRNAARSCVKNKKPKKHGPGPCKIVGSPGASCSGPGGNCNGTGNCNTQYVIVVCGQAVVFNATSASDLQNQINQYIANNCPGTSPPTCVQQGNCPSSPPGPSGGPPSTCPSGETGTPPNCQPETCPSGETGTPPNCQPEQCPAGTHGTPPNCLPNQQDECTFGFTNPKDNGTGTITVTFTITVTQGNPSSYLISDDQHNSSASSQATFNYSEGPNAYDAHVRGSIDNGSVGCGGATVHIPEYNGGPGGGNTHNSPNSYGFGTAWRPNPFFTAFVVSDAYLGRH